MNSLFKIIAELDDNASPGLAKLSGTLGEIGKGLVVGAIGTGLVMMVNKFGEAVQKTIDFGDELGKLSQKLGISSTELSGLAYAGDLAGLSLQQMANGYKRLAQSMFEAQDVTSEQAGYFRALGIEVTDTNGKLKSTEQVMYELADVFKDMEDGPEKTAIAMKLLGKAGVDMIPALNQGSEALKKFKEEAAEFGAVWNKEQSRQAEEYNDNITRLGKAVEGLFTRIAQMLLPSLISLTEALITSAKEGGTLNAVFDVLKVTVEILWKGAIAPLIIAVSTLSTAFNTLGKIIGGVAAAIGAVMSGDFKGAQQILLDMTNDVGKAIKEQIAFTKSLYATGDASNVAAESNKKTSISFNELDKNVKKAREELEKFISTLSQEYNTIGLDDVEKKIIALDEQLKKSVEAKAITQAQADALFKEGEALIRATAERKANIEETKKWIETTKKANEAAISAESAAEKRTQDLQFENSLIGMNNEQRKIAIELRRLEQELAAKGVSNEKMDEILTKRKEELQIASEQQQLEQLLSDTTDARIEKSREAMILLTKAFEEGKISQEQYLEAVEKGLDRLGVKAKETADEMTEFFKSAAQGIQQSLSTFLFDFMQGKMTDLSGSIKKVIDKMVADMLAAQAATLLFGSNFGRSNAQGGGQMGGLVGSLFSGLGSIFGRASGGPVSANRPYIVGEKRPELFVPRSNGTIIPSLDGLATNVNINISAMDGTDVMRVLSRSKREIAEMITTTNRSYNLRGS